MISLPYDSVAMPPRMSTRSSTRRAAKLAADPAPSNSKKSPRTTTSSRAKSQAVEISPGVFPDLDDTTAGLVMSYMSCTDFGRSALVSKAWLALNSDESLWRPLLAHVDPVSTLGVNTIKKLASQFSCKQVVTELSTRLCSLCLEPTNGFFVLTCTRVCRSCFQTDARVKMCSLSYAKSHYLLSPSQVAKLPTLYAEQAEETGCQFSKEAGVTVAVCSAAKSSAVARWGSEKAFENEMTKRKVKAQAAYGARKQAYDDQERRSPASAVTTSAADGTGALESGGASEEQSKPPPPTVADKKPFPSHPRILKLESEMNYVGVNQQKYCSVRGEKYGYFTVVNDAFFDSGPKIVITDTPIDDGNGRPTDGEESIDDEESTDFDSDQAFTGFFCSCGHCFSTSIRLSKYDRARQARGQELITAMGAVEPGTTIEIAQPVLLTNALRVKQSVRFIGSGQGGIEMQDGPFMIGAPSVVRNMRMNRSSDAIIRWDYFGGDFPDVEGPAMLVHDDVLLENCLFDSCPVGQAVLVQGGRLVARQNTFQDVYFGIVASPFEDTPRPTTVYLDGNHFVRAFAGSLCKGPPRCHPQDDRAIIEANKGLDSDYNIISW